MEENQTTEETPNETRTEIKRETKEETRTSKQKETKNNQESKKKQTKSKAEKYLYQEGKDIIKEIPLSKFEWPLLIAASAAAGMLFFLDRMQIVPQATGTAVLILIIFMWGMYLVKYMFFFPRGNKVIVIRSFKSSGIQFSVEKIGPDKLIHFDKNDDSPPVPIDRVNKHFEVSTGRPVVIAIEEVPRNVSLQEQFTEERSAKEFNNIIKTTWGTAWQSCLNNMLKFSNKIKDPMFIITIVVLLVVIVIVLLQLNNSARILEMGETLAELAGTTG